MIKNLNNINIFIFGISLLTIPLTYTSVRGEAARSKHWSKHKIRGLTDTDVERWADIFEHPIREKWQKPDEVIQYMNIKEGDIIADIGGGTGYFARNFALTVGHSGKVISTDIEPAYVKYMQEDAKKLGLKNYEARITEPHDPGLDPSSIDIIFICNTYFHIKNQNFLMALAKGLKKEGRIIIIDFYKKETKPIGPPYKYKISKEMVLSHFKQAGYTLKRDIDLLKYQYFLEFEL